MVALETPTDAVAEALIVRVIELTALVHGAAALAVRVSVTFLQLYLLHLGYM